MGCFVICLLLLIALAFPTLAAILALVFLATIMLGACIDAHEAEQRKRTP